MPFLLMAPSTHLMPRSLTHPGGAFFLDPAHRVTREELDRRDARWRALRERAYQRAWSDDATLVGSIRYYAAASARQRSATSILSDEQVHHHQQQQQRPAAATRLGSVEEDSDFHELCSVASASTTTPYTTSRQTQTQAIRGSTPSVRSIRSAGGRRTGDSGSGGQRIRNAFKKWVNSKRR